MADVKTDRRQALELALASIDRQFGKGAIMRLGQGGAFDEIAVITRPGAASRRDQRGPARVGSGAADRG